MSMSLRDAAQKGTGRDFTLMGAGSLLWAGRSLRRGLGRKLKRGLTTHLPQGGDLIPGQSCRIW